MKGIYLKPMVNIFSSEDLEASSLKLGASQGSCHHLLYLIFTRNSGQCTIL